MGALWQIRLFGILEARQGTTVISHFTTSRVAALLARLALLPHRAHSREELAGLLWPEADEEAGRLNLRVALSSLRHQMEPPGTVPGSILVTDRLSIRLSSDACTSDAAQFETALREAARCSQTAQKRDKLEAALALYDGDLLPGFYDEWVLEERERLQARYEEAKLQCRALPSAWSVPMPDTSPAPDASSAPAPDTNSAPCALLSFPGQFTRFFGRTDEQQRLSEMLADPGTRLVTLLGPGGSGKTRLAVEAARQARDSFDGPVCFAALADISDSALLPSTAAAALRLPLSGGTPPREQVAALLASGRSLLVLDNLEHLGAEGAAEVGALLEAVPGLTCLVTSRQTLQLAGEHTLLLAPLPVPPDNPSADPDDPSADPDNPSADSSSAPPVTDYPGVQLFVDRARLVRPEFAVTPRNAQDIAAVCRSLEGLPLALELAAARIQALSPGQMRQQLDARLDFLTSRRRDLPPRHRSLRAALEWSVHLLTPEQKRFFAQLSVFRGGWTLAAAAAVCEVPNPLDVLEQLCERSLISAEETPLGVRFRLLESLREFGEEKLASDERLALSRRHADYFHTLAAARDADWCGPNQKEAQSVLDAEQDNLRALLSFCRTDPESSETGLRTVGALGNYWTVRGLLREGLAWLEQALDGPGSADARAKALAMSGWMAGGLCDYPKAKALLTEAIELTRPLGDKKALASALRMRGVITLWEGKSPPAADFNAALTLSRECGDATSTAIVLNSLGVMVEQWERDQPKAQQLYEEALAIFLRVGDQQRASYCLHNLGNIAHDAGQHDRAVALGRQSLALADALGDQWHRAYCLRSLGDAVMGQGDLSGAAVLLEEGRTLSRHLGDRSTEAGILLTFAALRRRQGDRVEASSLARAALLLYQSMNHDASVTECWMSLAETAAAQADWPLAAALLSAADTSRAEFANDSEQERAAALCHASRAALSLPAFAAAWERGRTLTCDDYGLR